MTAAEALRLIAQGRRPDGELLPPCRLEAFGTEFYGEEAIVECFRAAPIQMPDQSREIVADGHVALFDGETALVADVFGDNILRIWRLGSGEAAEAEPAIGVPFDPDLMQSRGDVAMRAEDHPALSREAIPHVETIGRSIARDWTAGEGAAPYRCRAFLVRAFSQGSSHAALFAVHRVSSTAVRTTAFAYAAAFIDVNGDEPLICVVRDKAGEAAGEQRRWRPRVE